MVVGQFAFLCLVCLIVLLLLRLAFVVVVAAYSPLGRNAVAHLAPHAVCPTRSSESPISFIISTLLNRVIGYHLILVCKCSLLLSPILSLGIYQYLVNGQNVSMFQI